MDELEEYLMSISSSEVRSKLEEIIEWMTANYPNLEHRISWGIPMFTDHGTFIIGYSTAKKHVGIACEQKALKLFHDQFIENNYELTKGLFKIKLDQEINFDLIKAIIDFNVSDKVDCKTFFRK